MNYRGRDILILENLMHESSISQRDLAKRTGVSLGLVNLLLKELVRKGWIVTSPVNKKRMKYLLTSAGSIQLAQNHHREAIAAIRTYRSLRKNLKDLVRGLREDGFLRFSIHGDGELKELALETLREIEVDAPLDTGEGLDGDREIVLNLTTGDAPERPDGRVVDVLVTIMKGSQS